MTLQHPHTSILLAALAVVGLAVAPTAAVAQSEDAGVFSVDLGDDVSSIDVAIAVVSGEASALFDSIGDRIAAARGTGPTADDEADALVDEITTHRTAYRDHLNLLIDEYDADVSNKTEVLRVDIEDDDGTESVFVRVVANGSQVTDLNASRSQGDWTVTRSHELSAAETEDLRADLVSYRETYVEDGETPETSYWYKIGSKYTNISEVRR